MDWYYAADADRKGPVNEEEFQRLVEQGTITPQTLVWRQGFSNWQPYGASAAPAISADAPRLNVTVTCTGCGRSFAPNDVIRLGEGSYCVGCKPLALQRLKEGVTSNTGAEAIRKEHISHEASVQSIGLLYYLGGALIVCFGAISLVRLFAPGGGLPARGVTGLVSVFFLGLGAIQFWLGTGLRRLRKWARIPTGILSGIGLLGFPLGTLINAYVLYLIFSRKGKTVFSDEYQLVIQQTPQIKYRTSIIVWILIGLVLLLIGVALLGAIFSRR